MDAAFPRVILFNIYYSSSKIDPKPLTISSRVIDKLITACNLIVIYQPIHLSLKKSIILPTILLTDKASRPNSISSKWPNR